MNITKKTTDMDYIEFIRSIDARIETLHDIAVSPNIVQNTLLIRHDVDHDMDHALGFAKKEAQSGIKATYFLLHTAPYFNYSEQFASQCKELVGLGHDIGLHNNAITTWIINKQNGGIRPIIERPLEFLRKQGIYIKGTSSHGDPLCYKYNYVNYEIWNECPRERKNKALAFESYSLKDFGLDYEAYFVKRDAYLSDSGGIWRGSIKTQKTTDFSIDQKGSKEIDVERFVNAFNQLERNILHLLVHPMWWEIESD